MTFSLGTTNDEFPPRETELLLRLTEIAKQRGFDDPVECATETTRKILRVCPKTSGGITKFSQHEAD